MGSVWEPGARAQTPRPPAVEEGPLEARLETPAPGSPRTPDRGIVLVAVGGGPPFSPPWFRLSWDVDEVAGPGIDGPAAVGDRSGVPQDGPVDVHARTAANRRVLADFFDGLNDDQLSTRSLCPAWTVREVLGHLVSPLTGSLGQLLREIVRQRGSVNRASEAIARDVAQRPVAVLTSLLRDQADVHGRAPGVGPMGQMTDGCVHLRDCARPLGLADDVTLADWRMVLDWLPPGVPGLVPRRRLAGLSLRATDQDWAWGSGDEVSGPSEALAMAVSGREVALDDLSGPGLDALRGRLEGRR